MKKYLNYLKISLLTVLFSIPVITIGTAYTAGMFTAMKMERGEEAGIWAPFWKSFRQNFLQTLPANLIFLVLLGLLGKAAYGAMVTDGVFKSNAIGVILVIGAAVVLIIALAFYPFLARYDLKIGRALQNTLIVVPMNLLHYILMIVIFGFAGFIGYLFWEIFAPADILILIILVFAILMNMAPHAVGVFDRMENPDKYKKPERKKPGKQE